MNAHVVKTIYKFNQQAGLLEDGYKDERECAFPIEEALEGLFYKELHKVLGGNPDADITAKDVSREIMNIVVSDNTHMEDVDRFDKHLDIIVFAFGSLFKLGLTPQQVMRGLEVVMAANMTKLDAGKDEYGKQKKHNNFVGPEADLQIILNER